MFRGLEAVFKANRGFLNVRQSVNLLQLPV